MRRELQAEDLLLSSDQWQRFPMTSSDPLFSIVLQIRGLAASGGGRGASMQIETSSNHAAVVF